MNPTDPMPRRDEVDPRFDGHAERPFERLTPEEKLEWLWGMMELLAAGARARRDPRMGLPG